MVAKKQLKKKKKREAATRLGNAAQPRVCFLREKLCWDIFFIFILYGRSMLFVRNMTAVSYVEICGGM